ncbi:hypothetical protein DFH09DRAFT_1280262 [Mycena vulgaris]|nr:hypothetical protein DFH09DRAFT_1280262 [Mycena vulgaris]
MSIDTLSTICTFSFTHLKEIRISPVILSHSIAIALQQLFGLPTLRFVRLQCSFNSPSTLIEIWDRCAPGLKHLELRCAQAPTAPFHSTSHRRRAPIRLNSLRIMAPSMGMRDWMDHPLFPFDFSGLRVLSISDRIEVLRWSKITPALRTVEALDFAVSVPDTRIDLSSCLDLVFLRISVNVYCDWPMVLNTVLSTIAPSNHIRKIVISGVFSYGLAAEELDARLSSPPMHHLPAFHFEIDPDDSTNMTWQLCRAERHRDDWFHSIAIRSLLQLGSEKSTPRFQLHVPLKNPQHAAKVAGMVTFQQRGAGFQDRHGAAVPSSG